MTSSTATHTSWWPLAVTAAAGGLVGMLVRLEPLVAMLVALGHRTELQRIPS